MSEKYDWYTPLSEVFMGRGYFHNDATIQDRVESIARTVGDTFEDEEIYEKVKDYIEKGYYVLPSPVWSNVGTNRGAGISCLTGDSWINTKHEGGTQMFNIKIGDEVLTHKGRYRKVIAVTNRESTDDIYSLKVTTRMTPIKITGNHPVLTNLGWIRVDELDPQKHFIATNSHIEWEEKPYSIEIDKENYLKQNYRFNSHKNIIDKIDVDEDLAWALGLWFAEGSVSIDKTKMANGVRITMGLGFESALIKWGEILTSKFGISNNLSKSEVIRNQKKNTWYNVNVNSVIIGRWFSDVFGVGCKEKNIPLWLKELPKNLLAKFFEGFYLGDGNKTRNVQSFTIANPKLAMSLYEIGLKCGYRMGLQMQQKPGLLSTTKFVYVVSIYCNQSIKLTQFNAASGIKFDDGLIYCPYNLIKLNHNEQVYDITVEEDHSFSVSGVVVHNCFNTHFGDSIESIVRGNAEVAMLCKMGGGTSGYFGDIRPAGSPISTGGTTFGAVHFMKLPDITKQVVSQGNTRRGEFAGYLPIDHGDIKEFLNINGEGSPLQRFPFGVCVPTPWLNEMVAGDQDKREVWAMVLDSRNRTGFPYIFYSDNVNKGTADVYKDKGMEIKSSNMCSEILLTSNEEESFVCDLIGMNLVKFDEWSGTDAVRIALYIADAVLTDFITKYKGSRFIERTIAFAERHRAVGIGASGYHSYLQSKMVAFESMEAKMINAKIFSTIQSQAIAASEEMAAKYGKPELLKEDKYKRRHTCLMAIAPNTSSSFIMGQQSQSIEPYVSNYYIKKTAKVKHSVKNPYLKMLLEEKGKDTFDVWQSILEKSGSVQHLDFLTTHEKNVFATFMEISQMEVIIQAAQRQQFIDQGQSLNLMIHPSTPTKDVNTLLLKAHELGIKTLYYQLGISSSQELARDILSCLSCAG